MRVSSISGRPMDCTEFLSSYTDFRDGLLDPERRARMERHRASCRSCRRYERVVEKGVGALRALPGISVPADFRPRLQHRIYHVEDGDLLAPPSASSGASPVAVLGIAFLLTVAAWSPALRRPDAREVELPPIVVSERPTPPARPGIAASTLFGDPPSLTDLRDADETWQQSTFLLRSSLFHPRARTIQAAQAGIE